MNSRERVRAALARRAPDRLPADYWATPEVTARLVRELGVADEEALLRRLGVDIRYLGAGGGYILAPSHNLQPDVPTANILALYDEAAKCGY